MGQALPIFHQQWFQSAALATGGSVAAIVTTSAAPYTDAVILVEAYAFIGNATGGHLVGAARMYAECVVLNKNNVCTFGTAIATSLNPINSNSAGFALTSTAETAESNCSTSTAVFTINAGNNLVLTVTNQSAAGGVTGDISVHFMIRILGST